MSNNKKFTPVGIPTVELEEVQLDATDLPTEAEETVEEIIEAAVVQTVAKAGTYIAVEGDTYAGLGKKFVKSGETPFQAAQRISAANGGRSLTTGTVVTL